MRVLKNKKGGLAHQLSIVLVLLLTTYLLRNVSILSKNTNKIIKTNNDRTISMDKNNN